MQPVGVDHAGLGRSCQSVYLLSGHVPRCRWLVGHLRPGEYTRRLPIDNLERARHDLEDGRRAAGQLTVGFDSDRLFALDFYSTALGKLHLLEPAMRAPVQHRQATDSQHPPHVPDGHHLEEAIVGPGFRCDPHAAAKKRPIGHGDRSDPTTQHRAVDNLVGGAVATYGDDQPIAGGRRGVGSITSAAGLDHLEVESGTGTTGGTPFPETTGAAVAGSRVDDDERPVRPHVADAATPRIRLAFCTSRVICCCNAGTVANRRSPRSRWTNQTVSTES